MKYNHIYGNTGLDLLVTGWLNASKCLYELQEIRRDFAPSLVTPLPRTVAGTPRLCRHPEVVIVFNIEEEAILTSISRLFGVSLSFILVPSKENLIV